MPIRVVAATGQGAVVQRILATLPEWFGIPESNARYVSDAAQMPALLAHMVEDSPSDGPAPDSQPVGILLYQRHFPQSGEIHLIAVDRAHRGRGAGRALVGALESDLRVDGASLLSVKTLGPSHPDQNYAATRAFYRSLGFLPLEELPDLWPGNPCLIMVKPL